jgi:hypothetical protein
MKEYLHSCDRTFHMFLVRVKIVKTLYKSQLKILVKKWRSFICSYELTSRKKGSLVDGASRLIWNINMFRLASITNLMHNSFILYWYIYYIIILNMFRVILCPSSGGQIVLLQHLVSSLFVSSRTVYGLRTDCSPFSTGNWSKSILWCTVRKTPN